MLLVRVRPYPASDQTLRPGATSPEEDGGRGAEQLRARRISASSTNEVRGNLGPKMWAIYFDTNPLQASGWPRVSVGLQRAIDLAHFMGIPLFVPEPVEIELEEAWVRDFKEKTASIGSSHKDLGKHTANIVEVGAVPVAPTEAAAREAYRRGASAAKVKTGIESIPTTTRPIRDFVELAARRRRPFNEKGHGFRDSVILSTILGHAPAHDVDHCALVTLDRDFEGTEVQADFEAAGVHLHIYGVNQLVDALNEGLEAANREDVAKEHSSARTTIEGIGQILRELSVIVSSCMTLIYGPRSSWDRFGGLNESSSVRSRASERPFRFPHERSVSQFRSMRK